MFVMFECVYKPIDDNKTVETCKQIYAGNIWGYNPPKVTQILLLFIFKHIFLNFSHNHFVDGNLEDRK